MLLGVDFGTTRTIVAQADRGNYPVVSFVDEHGDPQEFFPSVVARDRDDLVYGFAALEASRRGAPCVRSFKRALGSPEVNPDTTITIGARQESLLAVLTGFFEALRTALAGDSSIADDIADDEVTAVVSVPAHAHGAQRFLTLEAFRRAGFRVAAMINEPSAAGFEYTHRQPRSVTSRRNQVVVYDLGGGTFDSSLVQVEGTSHEVLGSLGVNRLGGDDFDLVLAEQALTAAGLARTDLDDAGFASVLEECREAKERLAPQSKRIVLEVAGTPVIVPVEDFYTAATPLVEASIEAMTPLVGVVGDESKLATVAGIYLVGGGSGLPLVPRLLRQRFGRRVHRSPYPAASTAIGLAIAADAEAGFSLTDRLSRGFGVFRELDSGRALGFDQILSRDAVVSVTEPIVVTRRYLAAHNLGWYRYVEYTTVDEHGEPRGDLVPFADVLFPFDPELQDGRPLDGVTITRRESGPLVEETYTVDPHGIVSVVLTDLDTGYTQEHALHAG